eukprot:g5977.t1
MRRDRGGTISQGMFRLTALLSLLSGGWGYGSSGWSSRARAAEEDLTAFPIVAIYGHPANNTTPECRGDCDYVKAAYVNWLASAGVRSLPIRYDATPQEIKPILDGVNALLLPGGNPPVTEGARWAVQYAKGLNDNGDFFPVWGTCLGWEWMAESFAGGYPIISFDFDAENFTQPLGLLPDAATSRMLSGFPSELLVKMATEPLATNAHHKGVAPLDMMISGLGDMFRVVAINADKKGVRTYVSMVEAFDYPMYGLQWHPEKSQFDWGLDPDGTPHHVISHTKDAVEVSQMLAFFFASETRRNGHSFADITEWEPQMFHNRQVTPSGPKDGQMYYMHLGGDATHGSDSSQSLLGEGCCTSDVKDSGELCSETMVAPCIIDDKDGDDACSNGLPGYEASDVCCPLSCGTCGGSGCSQLGEGCCTSDVKDSGELCSETMAAPCIIDDKDGDDDQTCSNGLPGWLNDNELETLPSGVFDSLTALRSLRLSANGLTSLPSGLFHSLTELEDLFLQDNELMTLPSGIFDSLTKLLELCAMSNGLKSLRSGIFDSLTELDILDVTVDATVATECALRGDGFPPFSDPSGVVRIASKFELEGGGAGQVLMFQGIELQNFHFHSNQDWVESKAAGEERRTSPCAESLEALFGVIDVLIRRHLTGQAELWRVQQLTARLDCLTRQMRNFSTTNRELVRQQWFTAAFRAEFRKDMTEWENSVWSDGEVLKRQVVGRLPTVNDVGPLHLPEFSALLNFVRSAPLMYNMQRTAERVGEFFGGRHGYPEWERLVEIAEVGVPLSSVRSGGDLERELEYGNHRSAAEEEPAVWDKVLRDVATGKALVFPKRMAGQIPGLRVSPMGVVKEKEGKTREIHDLTVEAGEGRTPQDAAAGGGQGLDPQRHAAAGRGVSQRVVVRGLCWSRRTGTCRGRPRPAAAAGREVSQ